MAIDIVLSIPGNAAIEGTAAYRVKQAIDWYYRPQAGEQNANAPQTAAEYKSVVVGEMKSALRTYVRRAEIQQIRAAEQLPDSIDIDEN